MLAKASIHGVLPQPWKKAAQDAVLHPFPARK